MTVATSIQGPSDLLDVRRKILQQTIPLKAKILIFSTLYHRFSFSELDWQILRDQDLDNLLRHLYSAYPTPLELEERLFDTARNSEDPDEESEVARIICKFLKPCYPENGATVPPVSVRPKSKPPQAEPAVAILPHRSSLKTIDPQNEATLVLDYAREEMSAIDDEDDDDDRSVLFDPKPRPDMDTSGFLEQTTVPELRSYEGGDRPVASEIAEETEDLVTEADADTGNSDTDAETGEGDTDVEVISEGEKESPTLPPPSEPISNTDKLEEKRSPGVSPPSVGSVFSIANSLVQKLSWEEEVKRLVSDSAKAVMVTVETTVKELELSLEEKLTDCEAKDRFARKHGAIVELMGLLQGNIDRMAEALDRMAPQPEPKLEKKVEDQPTAKPVEVVPTKAIASTNSKLEKAKELARKGNTKAIATLLARDLKGRGIHPIATLKGKCLHLILESDKPLGPQKIVAFVERWIGNLGLEGVTTVKVYGRPTGQKSPDWSKGFDL